MIFQRYKSYSYTFMEAEARLSTADTSYIKET